jgi:hypothetical protein
MLFLIAKQFGKIKSLKNNQLMPIFDRFFNWWWGFILQAAQVLAIRHHGNYNLTPCGAGLIYAHLHASLAVPIGDTAVFWRIVQLCAQSSFNREFSDHYGQILSYR